MPVTFDGDISGDGTADISGGSNRVIFWSVDVLTQGPDVRGLPFFSPSHLMRVGFITLGDHFDLGGGDTEYWQPPVWLNFTHNLWIPSPSSDAAGNALSQFATLVRWALGDSTTAHLHVFSA
jgi:hypothetical protein